MVRHCINVNGTMVDSPVTNQDYSDTEVVVTCLLPPLLLPILLLAVRMFLQLRPRFLSKQRLAIAQFRDYVNYNYFAVIERNWQSVQVVLSFASGAIYVIDLYDESTDRKWGATHSIDMILTLFFVVDYAWAFFMAKDKIKFFFSFFALVDMYSIFPFIILTWMTDLNHASLVVRGLNAFRILRVLRAHRLLDFATSELNRQFLVVILTILDFFFCFTCLIQLVEDKCDNPFSFDDALWFVVITSTTVGYGDYYPITQVGRWFVMAIIFIGIVLVPLQTGKLISIIQALPKWGGRFKTNSGFPHVVVVVSEGAMSSLVMFLREFYHEDNNLGHYRVSLLSDTEPSNEVEYMLTIPFFHQRVKFLQGSPLVNEDLERAGVASAEGVFLVANQLATSGSAEDSALILRSIAINENTHNVRIYSEVLRRRNVGHMRASGADIIVCVDEIKMGLIAQTCLVPGLSTLVTNLVRSNSDVISHDSWFNEYAYGFSQEIYVQIASQGLAGKTFAKAVQVLYQQRNALLFGVQIRCRGVLRVWLNPGFDYTIREGDRLFVIATSAEDLECELFKSKSMVAADLSVALAELNRRERLAHLTSLGLMPDTTSSSSTSEYSDPDHHLGPHDPSVLLARKASPQELVIDDQFMREHAHDADAEFLRYNIYNLPDDITTFNIIPDWAIGNSYVKHPYSLEESLFSSPKENVWEHVYDVLPQHQYRSLDEIRDKVDHHQFRNHIVLAGSLSGVASFIVSLRSKRLEIQPDIVILNEAEPTEEMWTVIRRFPGVYVVVGSVMNLTDLYRVNMQHANTCVVLANNKNHAVSDEMMLDADTIFAVRSIMSKFANCRVKCLAELAHGNNTKFLAKDFRTDNYMPTFVSDDQPEAATGSLDDPSVNFFFRQQFASGRVFTSNVLDSMLCQSFIKPSLVAIIRQMVGLGSDACHAIISSQCYLIPIPQEFIGKHYRVLIEYYTTRMGIVPLGLYRTTEGGHNYVFTNPTGEDLVYESDRLYVLSRGPDHHYAHPEDEDAREARRSKRRRRRRARAVRRAAGSSVSSTSPSSTTSDGDQPHHASSSAAPGTLAPGAPGAPPAADTGAATSPHLDTSFAGAALTLKATRRFAHGLTLIGNGVSVLDDDELATSSTASSQDDDDELAVSRVIGEGTEVVGNFSLADIAMNVSTAADSSHGSKPWTKNLCRKILQQQRVRRSKETTPRSTADPSADDSNTYYTSTSSDSDNQDTELDIKDDPAYNALRNALRKRRNRKDASVFKNRQHDPDDSGTTSDLRGGATTAQDGFTATPFVPPTHDDDFATAPSDIRNDNHDEDDEDAFYYDDVSLITSS